MRNVAKLIEQGRADSDNSDYGTDRGIQQSSFIQWINDAQDKLEALLVSLHCPLLIESKEQDAVARQTSYSFPDDMFQDTAYDLIAYSSTGNDDDYYPLKQTSRRLIANGSYGSPSKYAVKGRYFLPSAIPNSSSGSFKVDYYKALPKIDLRRADVSAVVLGATSITSLTLDVAGTNWSEDNVDLIEALGYICVVDKDGIQQMRRIPVTSIDRTTGVVTIPTFAFVSGETIAAGNFIVAGYDATTHSELPDNCERYLIVYMAWKGQKKDSSKDARETLKDELESIEGMLTGTFAEPDHDVDEIPILDPELMEYE